MAEASLLGSPVSKRDAFVRAFLKSEKWRPSKLEKPRMIFPRDPRYNLALARYLKPFEHWLWGYLRGFCSRGVPATRDCAKGLNQQQRAALIRRKMSQIPGCAVLEVDGKAFEAHIEKWQLEQEHAVYMAAYPGDGNLQRLLGWQLLLRGVTGCGVGFERVGGRASGDFNTGMGNSLIMLCVVRAVLRELCGVFDCLCDGDNALVFLPPGSVPTVQANFRSVALDVSGHEMELDRPVYVLEEVRFGQSAPLEVRPGVWTMVRGWDKVLSQGTSTHIHLRETRFAREWLSGVAACESYLADGVPVLWAWANAVRRSCGHLGPVREHRAFSDYAVMGVPLSVLGSHRYASPPTALARESFFRAWGVDLDAQLEIEAVLSRGFELGAWSERPSDSFSRGDVVGAGLLWPWRD